MKQRFLAWLADWDHKIGFVNDPAEVAGWTVWYQTGERIHHTLFISSQRPRWVWHYYR